jgi:hypothetical protein
MHIMKKSERLAEEEQMHRLGCDYWRSPMTRKQLGLPSNETIKKFTRPPAAAPVLPPAVAASRAANNRWYQEHKEEVRQRRAAKSASKFTPGTLSLSAPPAVVRTLAAVAAHFHVTIADLVGTRGGNTLAWTRHVAMYVVHEQTGASFNTVKDWFNRKCHGAVTHGCRAVQARCSLEPETKQLVEYLVAFAGMATVQSPKSKVQSGETSKVQGRPAQLSTQQPSQLFRA